MSTIVKDKIVINNEFLVFINKIELKLFRPQDFGIEPVYYSSLMISGYYALYAVNENLDFVLKDLYVNAAINDETKLINGCMPSFSSKSDLGSKTTFYEYKNLNLTVPSSGFVLAGSDYLNLNKYRFSNKCNFGKILDVEIKHGKVVSIKDLSCFMETYRMQFSDGDIGKNRDKSLISKEINKWFDYECM